MRVKFLCLILLLVLTACQGPLTVAKRTEDGSGPSLLPTDGEARASLYPVLALIGGQYPETVRLSLVEGERSIAGDTQLQDGTVVFLPYEVLRPDTAYRFTAEFSEDGRSAQLVSSFRSAAVPLPSLWIEVALGGVQRVFIHEDGAIRHTFPCSGGTEETPSLTGCYFLQDRGESFYSPRWQEGALYWIRIRGQFLFHSLPRRQDGTLIEEEAAKLGQPASHGCIRLQDEDAKWLYDSIPDGTLVILHPGPPLP